MSLWTWGISLAFLGALPVGALAEVVGAPTAMAGSAALGLLSGAALIFWYAVRARREPTALGDGAPDPAATEGQAAG